MTMLAFAKPKIILLDDDLMFVNSTRHYLEKNFSNTAIVKCFTDYKEYMDFITDECYLPEIPSDLIKCFYSNDENPDKILEELSVLCPIAIIDKNLSEKDIDGTQLAKQIKEYFPTSYKILLTGCVNDKEAICLLNDGVIDLFINKGDDNSVEMLTNNIHKELNRISSSYEYDIEDALGFNTELNNLDYTNAKNQHLNEIEWKSYITLNKNGDLAIMTSDKNIVSFSYNKKSGNFL